MDVDIFYPCKQCPKQFKSRIFLRRHERRNHEKSPVICGQCNSPFARRDSLIRHERTVHARESFENLKREGLLVDIPEIFTFHECGSCGKKYKRRDKLRRHIFEFHSNIELLKCAHCLAGFRRKTHLIAHLTRKHDNDKPKPSLKNYSCLLCKVKFRAVVDVREHYTKVHKIILLQEQMKFDSLTEFKDWKFKLEESTFCRYVPKIKNECKTYSKTLYRCHRSGEYASSQPPPSVSKKKRKMKMYSSKKLNGFCPAEIALIVTHEDDGCQVTFLKTHIGHSVSDENELVRIYVRKEERQNLLTHENSSRVAEKNENGQVPRKLDIVRRYDFRNVSQTYRSANFPNEELNLETFVKYHSDSIVFMKKPSEMDTTYEMLNDDDLVLIIIDEEQAKLLQMHAHKLIALDRVCGSKPFGFTLHALMVLDDEGFAVAAAFLLTNRDDRSVIDIFLSFIIDTYGSSIDTCCLMTDMLRENYFCSWVKVMAKPEFRLMCSWRAREKWEENLLEISNIDEREIMRRKLHELINESDHIVFEEKIQQLFDDPSPNLKIFLNWFQSSFLDDAESWAFCYRQESRIKCFINLEAFDEIVEHFFLDGQDFQSCLYRLDEYMKLKERGFKMKTLNGTTAPRLKSLKERHRTALDHLKDATVNLAAGDEENEWLVSSCREKNENETVMEVYVVQQRVSKECSDTDGKCSLMCVECVSCVHKFTCSCNDAMIEGNMCEHIHALCLYLRESIGKQSDKMVSVILEENRDYSFKDEVDGVKKDYVLERRKYSFSSVLDVDTESSVKKSKLNERKRSTLERCFRLIDTADSEEAIDAIDEIIASIEPIILTLPNN